MLKNSQKLIRNSSYKAHYKLLLVLLMVCLISIPFISAWDFDNTGSYNSETKTMTIKNAFGLGEIIAEIKLNSELNVMVISGRDRKVAEFTISNFDKKYSNALKKMEFFDLNKNNKEINRNFVYKYAKSVTERQAPIQEQKCADCPINVIGHTIEEVIEWEKFNSLSELPEGKVKIGIFTKVYRGDYVDWIPTFFGVKINEWATWTSSLEEGLISYYELEESSGAVVDSIGNNNGTNAGATQGVAGKINNAAWMDGDDSYINISNDGSQAYNLTTFTITAWINRSSVNQDNSYLIDRRFGGDSNSPFYIGFGGGGNNNITKFHTTEISGGENTITSTYNSIRENTYYFIATTLNASTGEKKIYINGVLNASADIGNDIILKNSETKHILIGGLGSRAITTSDWHGMIDEFGMWNRTLSASEINNLWNSGDGIEYGEGILVDVSYPLDSESYLTYELNALNYSIESDGILDSCWYSVDDGVTNSSIVSAGINFTGLSPAIGSNTWYVYCNDSLNELDLDSVTFTGSYYTINSQTYINSTIEGATNNFILNLTYNEIDWSILTAILIYNNTNYAGNNIGSGNYPIFSKNVTAPTTAIIVNKTFYWEIGFTNSTQTYYYNSTSYNQTIEITNMSLLNYPYTVAFLNFTFYDEETLDKINGTIDLTFNWRASSGTSTKVFSYSNDSETETGFAFAFDPADKSYTINSILQYTATGYTNKFYNFEGITFTNATTEISLYLLNSSDATSFIIEVLDTNYAPVTNAEVYVQRYYPAINKWDTVEILNTNDDGETIQHLYTEDALYRFKIYENGVLLHTTSSSIISCPSTPCTVTIIIKEGISNIYEEPADLTTTLTMNSAYLISYTYTDTSGNFSQGRLKVIRKSFGEVSIEPTCNTTSTSSTAVLTCDLFSETNGTYIAYGYITRNGAEDNIERKAFNKIRSIVTGIGVDGVLWSIFFLIGIIMLGVYRPSLAIIFAVVGVIMLSLLQLMEITVTAIVAILGIGIVLLVEVRKQ